MGGLTHGVPLLSASVQKGPNIWPSSINILAFSNGDFTCCIYIWPPRPSGPSNSFPGLSAENFDLGETDRGQQASLMM